MQESSHKAKAFFNRLVRPGCSLRRHHAVSLEQQIFSINYHYDQRHIKAVDPFRQVESTQGSSLAVEPRPDQFGDQAHLVAHHRS